MTEVQDIPILKLIPQRPPFVMVDRLLETGDRTAVTEFVVRPDCILVEDGALTSYGLLENMAQTCAARIGWLNLDRPVKIGVIGAVRDFRIIRRPAVGAVLRTTVTERESVMNMTLADAVVEDAAGTVASAGLKIALRDDGPLSETLPLKIRFSEVDSMSVVWHGSYVKYFEDAREAFGAKYGLGYMDIFGNGYYAPLVELDFKYRKPLLYGSKPEVTIFYRPTEAAKIVFDYEIRDTSDGSLVATGHSVQVFMDKDYKLVWTNPPFYEEWKKRWKVF